MCKKIPKSRNGSENFAMISKARNGPQVPNGLDLRNNSKLFVILSTFGIFSKSARNAAETPDSEHRKETGNDCGNTHHLHFQHFPRAANYCLICCKFFFGKSLLYSIEIFVETQTKLFLFILTF